MKFNELIKSYPELLRADFKQININEIINEMGYRFVNKVISNKNTDCNIYADEDITPVTRENEYSKLDNEQLKVEKDKVATELAGNPTDTTIQEKLLNIKDEEEKRGIKAFAEAYHILQEDVPNDPKYWDIHTSDHGYAVYRPGIDTKDGFAGDFTATEMEKLFKPNWKDMVKSEKLMSSVKTKYKKQMADKSEEEIKKALEEMKEKLLNHELDKEVYKEKIKVLEKLLTPKEVAEIEEKVEEKVIEAAKKKDKKEDEINTGETEKEIDKANKEKMKDKVNEKDALNYKEFPKQDEDGQVIEDKKENKKKENETEDNKVDTRDNVWNKNKLEYEMDRQIKNKYDVDATLQEILEDYAKVNKVDFTQAKEAWETTMTIDQREAIVDAFAKGKKVKIEEVINAKINEDLQKVSLEMDNLILSYYNADTDIEKKSIKANIDSTEKILNKLKISSANPMGTGGVGDQTKNTLNKDISPTPTQKPDVTVSPVEKDNKSNVPDIDKKQDAFDLTEGIVLPEGYVVHKDAEKDEIYVLDKQGKEIWRTPNAFVDDTTKIIDFFTKALNLTPMEKKPEDKNMNLNNPETPATESKEPKEDEITDKKDQLQDIKDKLDALLNNGGDGQKSKEEQEKEDRKNSGEERTNKELAELKQEIDKKEPKIKKIIESLIKENKITADRSEIQQAIIKGEEILFARKHVIEEKIKKMTRALWAMKMDQVEVLENVFVKKIKASNENSIDGFLMTLND
jgi:hypothetical protein